MSVAVDCSAVPGMRVLALVPSKIASSILTPEALRFLQMLHRSFNTVRKQLLLARMLRQRQLDDGVFPTFLSSTKHIRDDQTWQGPSLAPGLIDRRVEITGPVDRKMVVNALNSGALTFMADFEDSSAPTWDVMTSGQLNLRDAIHRCIDFTVDSTGKQYKLRKDGKIATLLVRPRGWHLDEKHVLIDGEPCSASLFDFALYFFHNARKSIEIGAGPYFYLPKLESHIEARLWNDVFNLAQDAIGLPRGTIRATVLIETILAAFEMDEIIYELRQHSAGLNCGRWDYIFSYIKKFRQHPQFVLPSRADVTMTAPFMDAYVRLLIKTCHARSVHAMGGMAAQIPIKDNPQLNQQAMTKVRADKLREVQAGHDGTWVAHPDLVSIALDIFSSNMTGPNQLYRRREDVQVTAQDLISNCNIQGSITEQSVRSNISVALMYTESWLRGVGCVPIHNLMEDAATAEIARSQLWQWVRHGVRLSDQSGKMVTLAWVQNLVNDEVRDWRNKLGEQKYAQTKIEKAKYYLLAMIQGREFPEFITTLCYDQLVSIDSDKSKL